MNPQPTAEIILAPARPSSALTVWHVSPEDEKQNAVWLDCLSKWLDALEARSHRGETRRAYQRDLGDFFLAWRERDLQFWQVSKVHVLGWVEQMRRRNLSDATINRRLAAMSSFYTFAAEEYTVLGPQGERALWPHGNPFKGRSLRPKVTAYGRSTYLGADEVRAVLRAIDLNTLTGWRNMALLYGLFATTRRVNEWVNLRWGDVHDGAIAGEKWFTYRYKGGDRRRQVIPADLWSVITEYLRLSKRGELAAGDPIFIAHSTAAERFAHVTPGSDPDCISASYVNRLLKRYGQRSGIDPAKLHAHALRHAGARFRKAQGADIWHLKDILGHSSIAITQIYADEVLDEPADQFSALVGQVLPDQLRLRFPAGRASARTHEPAARIPGAGHMPDGQMRRRLRRPCGLAR